MSIEDQLIPPTNLPDADDAKDQLRHFLRRQRRQQHRHPESGHNDVCAAFTTHALEAVGNLNLVAAYVSVGHEPCTRLLLEQLHARGVKILLPVLGPHLSRTWGYYKGSADLAERAPGRPPEPSGQPLSADELGKAEALIIPALAIDRCGKRLGQGGGWYDRVLPKHAADAPVFAMVYTSELVDTPLPSKPHDQSVDAVITPEEWFLLAGSVFSGRC